MSSKPDCSRASSARAEAAAQSMGLVPTTNSVTFLRARTVSTAAKCSQAPARWPESEGSGDGTPSMTQTSGAGGKREKSSPEAPGAHNSSNLTHSSSGSYTFTANARVPAGTVRCWVTGGGNSP